jgi:hypothetical protein
MKPDTFQLLCQLSKDYCGQKYYWKKLLRDGIIISVSKPPDKNGAGGICRRAKLTPEQAVEYFQVRLKAREQQNAGNTKRQNIGGGC